MARTARRFEFDTVLTVRLGEADREFDARIQYRSGRFEFEVERIELCVRGTWISTPLMIDLMDDCAPLFDELRAHAAGVLLGARATAKEDR